MVEMLLRYYEDLRRITTNSEDLPEVHESSRGQQLPSRVETKMASDDEDVPESGAVFTFGKSRFLDNKFWIRNDAVIHVACGDEHSAVVTENGKLYTFGSNDWGQLGQGSTVQFTSPKLVKRLKPEKVKLVAAGRNHTIVSTESGKLYSFGCGGDGQLGHGNCEDSNLPKAIESLADQQYKALACGSESTAAVTVDGQLYTWGASGEGQTGQGSEDCETPTRLHLKGKVVAVACGYYHMAVVTDDGSLYTCGESENGKLGLADSQLDNTSQLQKLLDFNDRVIAVACGGNHTVAVTDTGKLYTFGQGDHGQLGLGSSCLQTSSPKQVTSLGNVHVCGVACGESHTAIITKHSNLYTCGDGRHGKLGMGEESFSNLFRLEKVTRFDDFVVQEVSCGGCHTLVTAIRKSEVEEGTDSEAEAEKDILSASISSTKSLVDAVDGPQAYMGGLSATVPAGGTARNKRRQRNIENLGNSIGGSLPPINKSSLPPLPGFGSRTLPALSKLPSKEEKVPVNPFNMSTLPKISADSDTEENDKRKKQPNKDNKLSDDKVTETKVTKQHRRPKDAESSSGISESEEEEEDEGEESSQTRKIETAGSKEDVKKDKKPKEEESEESMTEDESDSEEEESDNIKGKREAAMATTSKVAREDDKVDKDRTKKCSEKEEEEESEEEEEEEEDDEEDSEEEEESGKRSEKKEQLKVVGKKMEIKKNEKKKKVEDDEDLDEEESEEDDDDDDDDEDDEGETENKKNKKEQAKASSKVSSKDDSKDKGKQITTEKGAKKKNVRKKEEAEEESEEEEEEEEEDDDDDEEKDESEEEGKEKEAEKDDKKGKKSSKDKTKDKDDRKKDKDDDVSDKKSVDNKKDKKKKEKKGKEKDDKEEGEDEAVDDNKHKNEEHDENENKGEKTDKDSKNKSEDGASKPAEAAKTKEKKSGICVLL